MACACPTCGQVLPVDADLTVDPAGIVVRGGRFATLTRQEAALFDQLRKARGAVRTKEQLLTSIYLVDADEPEIKIIDVIVCKLRKKLTPLGVHIGTVWGHGYRLVATKQARVA